jgi:hypothetical protein
MLKSCKGRERQQTKDLARIHGGGKRESGSGTYESVIGNPYKEGVCSGVLFFYPDAVLDLFSRSCDVQ